MQANLKTAFIEVIAELRQVARQCDYPELGRACAHCELILSSDPVEENTENPDLRILVLTARRMNILRDDFAMLAIIDRHVGQELRDEREAIQKLIDKALGEEIE